MERGRVKLKIFSVYVGVVDSANCFTIRGSFILYGQFVIFTLSELNERLSDADVALKTV